MKRTSTWLARCLTRTNVCLAILALVIALSPSTARAEEETERLARLNRALNEINTQITDAPSPLHHRRAAILFQLGRFEEAIADYDRAIRAGAPHDEDSCWERGLAQYYAGDFRGGAEQFARYHRVGSLDIENGLWRLMCIAESDGIEKGRETMFDYPRRLRLPFPALLDLYLGKGSEEAVLAQAKDDTASPEELNSRLFYAHYYLGKYYELTNGKDRAKQHITTALKHRIPHFMYACAEIDVQRLNSKEADL